MTYFLLKCLIYYEKLINMKKVFYIDLYVCFRIIYTKFKCNWIEGYGSMSNTYYQTFYLWWLFNILKRKAI